METKKGKPQDIIDAKLHVLYKLLKGIIFFIILLNFL